MRSLQFFAGYTPLPSRPTWTASIRSCTAAC
jgi:hypothetical protein